MKLVINVFLSYSANKTLIMFSNQLCKFTKATVGNATPKYRYHDILSYMMVSICHIVLKQNIVTSLNFCFDSESEKLIMYSTFLSSGGNINIKVNEIWDC